MTQVIGHDPQIEVLRKLASERKLAHGYIFFGAPMVGKRTVAEALAHFLERGTFGQEGSVPLNDHLAIGPDEKGTVGIDAVRKVRSFLSQTPNASSCRTVIINEGHLMTDEAQNALLAVAENPPSSALLILIVQDPEILLATLRSRLQAVYFSGVPQNAIAEWLSRVHGASKQDAARAAATSYGAPGRAWRALNDPAYQDRARQACQFLGLSPAIRRDYIKKLIEPDDFHLDSFLDDVILAAYETPRRPAQFLARALTVRRQAAVYNLNPWLQLEALLDSPPAMTAGRRVGRVESGE